MSHADSETIIPRIIINIFIKKEWGLLFRFLGSKETVPTSVSYLLFQSKR